MLDLILKNGLVCDPANSIQSIPKRPYRMPYERIVSRYCGNRLRWAHRVPRLCGCAFP